MSMLIAQRSDAVTRDIGGSDHSFATILAVPVDDTRRTV